MKRLAPLALLALAACDQPQVEEPIVRVVDPQDQLRLARQHNPIPLFVRGRVYPGPAEVTAKETLAIIQDKPERFDVAWALDRAPDAADGYHLTVLYNAAVDVTGDALCAEAAGGDPRPGGEIAVTLAFCQRARLLSSIRGRVAQSDGLFDDKTQTLLTTALLNLFPREMR